MSNAKIIFIAFLALVSMWFYSCATISSPQGGPRDSLPPTVKSATPVPFTTNFKGKRVTIDFSEYIQLKDQQKLFFVSPEMERKPVLSIKGRSIVVDFQDTLQPDQTYRLDFGSSVVDNNEGNKLDGLTYTFSTGATIDSMIMAGQVLYAQSRDTVVGAFVSYFDLLRDSTYADRGLDSTLFKTRAEALVRADSSGYFIADILKEKPYRIYAVADKNGNQRYETGTDMVAFIDSTFNPIDMPPFMFGYDSVTRRIVIDTVQFTLEVFQETLVKRQMLTTHSRPKKSQMQMLFNSPHVRIDSIGFDSIPNEWLIKDLGYVGDTVTYWIAPPTVEQYHALPDTIKGRMIYHKQDSVMQYTRDTVKLVFAYDDPERKAKEMAAKKEQEQAARDSVRADRERIAKARAEKNKNRKKTDKDQVADSTALVDEVALDSAQGKQEKSDEQQAPPDSTAAEKPKNPFVIQVKASSELNPESNIVITFDYPLVLIDSSKIELTEIVTEQAKGTRRNSTEQGKEKKTVVSVRTIRDNLRQVTLSADWKSGGKYELVIPSGVFKNTIHESNDTLSSKFSILDPDKYGAFTLKTKSSAATERVEVDSLKIKKSAVDTIAADTIARDSTAVDSIAVNPIAVNPMVLDPIPTVVVSEVDTSQYILELVTITYSQTSSEQKVIASRSGVKIGDTVKFRFLTPGDYYVRITRDDDGDGVWTTGDLRGRRHPERVRFLTENGERLPLKTKEGWDVEEIIDVSKVMRAK